jgi:hypothetical protein
MAYSEGSKVKWNWGDGTGTGEVKEVYTADVTKTLKGTEVTRNASEDAPAYLIEQSDGDEVLKSHSELESA